MSASSIRALFAALILSGCSTIAVDRAQELSETGRQYASTIKRVHELTLDRSIDYCAELIAHEQQDLGPDLLERRTDELRQRVALATRAEAELDALKANFIEFEAIAKGEPESDAAALGKVAGAIPLASPLNLTGDSLSGLSGLVGRRARAASVSSAISRSAAPIAQTLALGEAELDDQIEWLAPREKAYRERDYAQRVRAPFLSPGASRELGRDWRSAWSDYVRPPKMTALLNEAKRTSRLMRKTWEAVQRGSFSFDELRAALDSLKAHLAAADKAIR